MAAVAVENCDGFLARKASWVDVLGPMGLENVVSEVVDAILTSPSAVSAPLLEAVSMPAPSIVPAPAPQPPMTASDIYCRGDLLHHVQMAGLYPDSKTFVDMKLLKSPEEAKSDFEELMKQTGGKPSSDHIRMFVNRTFTVGDELEEWTPPDWKEEPALLKRINDEKYREWAGELNHLWKTLGRKIKDDVRDNPERYSLIYVPNGFVIPGGRFRELYYWDTYWIVQGMLHCDMADTVRGVIENLLALVQTLGFVPNGSRVYYEERSQPPLLISMAVSYYEYTKDKAFVRDNIATLEKEFEFWMKNTTVEVEKDGNKYTLARFYFPSNGPRPESYREDYETANGLTDEGRQRMYWELKSGAGSGWDFSTRWFMSEDGTNSGNLSTIQTTKIIPVDLNAFLYGAAKGLEFLHTELGNKEKALKYSETAAKWREAVNAVFWNEEDGIWYDWDAHHNQPRKFFFGSNFAPLWTECYDKKNSSAIAAKVVHYIVNSTVLNYRGGTPTSMERSGEQWDFPNCWAPLQAVLIQGLDRTGDLDAKELASELARRWVHANYMGWDDHASHKMFEKYDAEYVGRVGGGGEYDAQTGFGWSNGLIFELLEQYFTIEPSEKSEAASSVSNAVSSIITPLIPPLVSLLRSA